MSVSVSVGGYLSEHGRSMAVSVRCVWPAIRRVSVRGYVVVVEGSGYIGVSAVFVCCGRLRVHSRVQGYIQAWLECEHVGFMVSHV